MGKKLKLFPLGDPHIDQKTLPIVDAAIPQIYNFIEEEKPDLFVCLGDILEKPGRADTASHKRAVNEVLKPFYKKTGNKPYLVIGNHDRPNKESGISDEHFFNGYEEWLNVADKVIVSENCVFVPWVKEGTFEKELVNSGIDMARLDASHPERYYCVFAHVEIEGCQNDNLSISGNTDKWPSSRIPLITGHIHKYQRLSNNIFYPGTFYMKTFGEDENKGISFFEIDTETYEITEKRYSLAVPRKITLALKPADVRSFVPNGIDSYRLIVRGSTQEIDALARYLDDLSASGIKVEAHKNDIAIGATRAAVEWYDFSFEEALYSLTETEEEREWMKELGLMPNNMVGNDIVVL